MLKIYLLSLGVPAWILKHGSIGLANGGKTMFDLYHEFKKSTIFYWCLITSLSLLTACGGSSSSSDNIDNILSKDASQNLSVLLSGRVVKGVITNAKVSIYSVNNGVISNTQIASTITNVNGSFTVDTPQDGLTDILYLEATPSNDPQLPTLMTCDSINGCGTRNNVKIDFGDTFLVDDNFKLRSFVEYNKTNTKLSTQFTPLMHMAVAYAEALSGGLTKANIMKALEYLSGVFLFSEAINQLETVDLTVLSEMNNATDEELVAAILASTFMNIGQAPNYTPVETILKKITTQHGVLANNDTQNPDSLSLLHIANLALANIPGDVAGRVNISNQLNQIALNASNTVSSVELDVAAGSNGKIISSSHSFECLSSCQYNITKSDTVTLNAIADSGFEFTSWNNSCPGLQDQSHPICEFTLLESATVQAVFSPISNTTHNLVLTIVGQGSVTLDNENLSCSNNCAFALEDAALISLSATATTGSSLQSWTLDQQPVCGNNTSCDVTMSGDRNLQITFVEDIVPPIEYVALTVAADGAGIVSDAGLNLTCQQTSCLFQIEKGTTVNFSATPLNSNTHEFSGWQDLCSGGGNCVRTLNSDGLLTAIFSALPQQTLTINISGGGSVTDTSLNISCNQASCSTNLDFATQVNLSATANAGYVFDHWENDCTNFTNDCSVNMDSNHTVTAVFTSTTASTTVSWTAPTQRESGDALLISEVKKYIIYYGTESGVYIDAIEVGLPSNSNTIPTELSVDGLDKGVVYYFAGMTVDSNNLSSTLSNEVTRLVQ